MTITTTRPRRPGPPPPPPAAESHRAWLELVDSDGPFLSVPALKRVYPQGMPRPGDDQLTRLRDAKPAFEKAWERWDLAPDDAAALDAYREARDAWVETVLTEVIGWEGLYTTELTGAADTEVRSPNHAVSVRATGALVHDGMTGALVLVVGPVDSLRVRLEDGWAASPIDRMEELLRASGVPIGVVTDGRWWAIVSARKETMVASGIVDAQTWIEEPATRNAFLALLDLDRLLGRKRRLTETFKESVTQAEEITEALGVQVRRAVELLVQALSEGTIEAVRRGAPDPLPPDRGEVYDAAVTVMMRVVFLLFAEEQDLLPQSPLFVEGYGISGELDVLERRLQHEKEEPLDGTYLTWHRLLATSQALYRGVSFENMRLQSYGGSLFDPDRFAFLTARGERETLAITISDRVMLEVLRSVQMARLRGEPDAKRISFRDIDVEQIGYIYEGLLGYSCKEASEVTVGLIGKNGEEPEMALAELEELAAAHADPAALAAAILARVTETQAAAKPVSKAALTRKITAEVVDIERALRAVAPTDPALRERLRPFIGVIRRDLRNRPLVVQAGGVLVVETPSRATAGAHYTPRSLAEEVVEHALKPLVFSPGPYDTPDETAWRPLSSDEILELKVADIACGSGAFLVAAARYLAARLEEAWVRQGESVGYTARELELRAIREVVANCLYGADINALAVEMCKLSLWLVSLDKNLPFSFVDDKVLHGNSLLGLTDVEQLKQLHINPDQANPQLGLLDLDVDAVLEKAKRLRRRLASEIDDADPQRSGATKRRQWREYQELTAQLIDVADGVIAAGLKVAGKPGKALNEAYESLRIAVGAAYPTKGAPGRRQLEDILQSGLRPIVDTDYEFWKPLHWVIQVPDVIERGGFNAIIGNPPFLGGQRLTGAMGSNVRDWFIYNLASGKRGSADLVAYFLLRDMGIMSHRGSLGLIATNTVAQGDTREVGLDRITADGFTITRAIQSRAWPVSTANLEYAAIWGTRGTVADGLSRFADDVEVQSISTLLEPAGRVEGRPLRLAENTGISFQGCIVLGMGFVLDPDEAAEWIEADPTNTEVLLPYLGGKDLNSRLDNSASRWVIDFGDRTEKSAQQYSRPFERVRALVMPGRLKDNRKVYRDHWWQFAEKRPALRKAISGLVEVIVIAQTSATQIPALVSAKQIYDQKLVVFASRERSLLSVLSSSLHRTWTTCWGPTRTGDPVYTPSDVFETFPLPRPTERLGEIGRVLDEERREIMLRQELGLTKLYNLVNDPEVAVADDADVARMRGIHVELDHAVMEAYGWSDLALDHGFHTYRQMTRWTVSPAARVEILDRLLEENHRRAALQGDAPPAADEGDGDEVEGDVE